MLMKMTGLVAIVAYILFLVAVFLTFYATDWRMVALFVAVGTAVLVVALKRARG